MFILDFISNKHTVRYISCIILCIMLTGCTQPVSIPPSYTESSPATEYPNETQSNEYFKIYTGNTQEDHFYYYYDIFDLSGNIIKHECTYTSEPKIREVDKYVLRISAQAGTGRSTEWTYYYNIEKNVISPAYYYVLCEGSGLTAYFDSEKIIVSGMFDKEDYYKEITLGQALSNSTDPIISAEFSDDASSMTVTYLSGDNYHEITETVAIPAIDNSEDSADIVIDQFETKIISNEQYYKITKKGDLFQYYIFDDSHQIVKSGENFTKEPTIFMVNNHLLRFTSQAGTGLGTQWGFYYDVVRDSFSRDFYTIYDQYNDFIAYAEIEKIIIRDIFDKSKYYYEISSFENPLAENVVLPIEDAKFTSDGKSILVTYFTGNNYEKTTQIFNLK